MNTATSNFKPGVLGGALRKGLQTPEVSSASSTNLDGPYAGGHCADVLRA
jgi:hypothetical protein